MNLQAGVSKTRTRSQKAGHMQRVSVLGLLGPWLGNLGLPGLWDSTVTDSVQTGVHCVTGGEKYQEKP